MHRSVTFDLTYLDAAEVSKEKALGIRQKKLSPRVALDLVV